MLRASLPRMLIGLGRCAIAKGKFWIANPRKRFNFPFSASSNAPKINRQTSMTPSSNPFKATTQAALLLGLLTFQPGCSTTIRVVTPSEHQVVRSQSVTLPMPSAAPMVHSSNDAPDPHWLDHDRTRPQPPVITPAVPSTQEQVGKAPSDAVVLFDGTDLSHWASMDGSPTKWIMRDGYMECVKGSGYVRTLQNFGDCQLHVEFATPNPGHGEGQGRGNSGVFLGLDRYEIQVLDSYGNKTYADGGASAIYGQYPPLVNASLPAGKWQTYDILYTAPRFDAGGRLLSAARITVFHNGVLTQNNVQLTGPTSWLERAPYEAHPTKQPISLQDHGNPVRFRNIWVRELGNPGKNEFTFPNSLLDNYVGKYGMVEISREESQLVARVGGVKFTLFAESPTKFFAKTTDVQIEFPEGQKGKPDRLWWSVGEGRNEAKRD